MKESDYKKEIVSMNKKKMLGLILSMDMAANNRKRSNNMSVLYGKKHCASCEYWSGVREPDAFAERSRSGASDDGLCNNTKSSFYKRKTKANYSSCMKWEKWSKLTKMR